KLALKNYKFSSAQLFTEAYSECTGRFTYFDEVRVLYEPPPAVLSTSSYAPSTAKSCQTIWLNRSIKVFNKNITGITWLNTTNIIWENLALGMRFEEGYGDFLKDFSGNDNNGTKYGPNWTAGKYGSALSFDGVDDYVKILDSDSLDFNGTESFTITAWIKTSAQKMQFIINKASGSGSTYKAYHIFQTANSSNNKIRFMYHTNSSATTDCASTAPINDGNWHFIAAVRDVPKDKGFLYIDGDLNSSAIDNSVGNGENSGNITIGNSYPVGARAFKGVIDEMRIYNKALNASEIQSNYNNGVTRFTIAKKKWNQSLSNLNTITTRWHNITITAPSVVGTYEIKWTAKAPSAINVTGNKSTINIIKEFYYVESEIESTTTSTSFQDKVGLVLNKTNGDYLVLASSLLAHASTSYYTEAQLVIDGAVYGINEFMPSGSADTNYYPFGAHKIIYLNKSQHTIKIQYRSSINGYAAKIKNARIAVIKVTDYQTSISEPQSSTLSTTWIKKTALAFTPVAGDYLILGTADLSGESTSNSAYAQLIYNGISQGEMLREPTVGSQFYTYETMKKLNLTSAPHTFTIQYKTEKRSSDAYIKNARISAIKLSDLGSFKYAESEVESFSSSATYKNKTTLTLTVGGDYLIIATALVKQESIAYAVYANLNVDGTSYGEMIYRPTDGTDYAPFFAVKKISLSPGSHSIGIQYRTNYASTSAEAFIKNARIIAIRIV
ncbi:MAG: LamG domain-containing protein, partial [Euryarchaeota archaeon]|nr:LamG domain-containing protein [Euryarchaeota archaeon]